MRARYQCNFQCIAYYRQGRLTDNVCSGSHIHFICRGYMHPIKTICVASRATRHMLDDLLRQLPQCEVIAWVEPEALDLASESLRPELVLVAPSTESAVREPHVAYIKRPFEVRLDDEYIAFPSQESILIFPADMIVRLRGEGSYVRVFFSDRSDLLVAKTIGDCERALPKQRFTRVHRSHIVNVRHIRRMHRGRPTRLHMSNRDEVEVSDRYRDSLLGLLPRPVTSKQAE